MQPVSFGTSALWYAQAQGSFTVLTSKAVTIGMMQITTLLNTLT
jgi:hypothetical protein